MIALVTGANRGIGREVARQLAVAGHTVFLTARSIEAAAEAARAAGPDAHPLRLDVTSEADITAVARDLTALDVLVNNAAITYDTWQRATDADLNVVREAAETNLYGPWRLTQALLPLLRASTSPARSRPSRPWAAAPPRTRRPRRPSTPSPACSPPNWAPTGSS